MRFDGSDIFKIKIVGSNPAGFYLFYLYLSVCFIGFLEVFQHQHSPNNDG